MLLDWNLMKESIARIIFIVFDVMTILAALSGAFYLRQWCDWFERSAPNDLHQYTAALMIYVITLIVFVFEGIYTKRYDFWQEYQRLTRSLVIACVIVFAILTIGKMEDSYSRFIIIAAFVLMFVFFPFQKYVLKRYLYRIGIWKKGAYVIGSAVRFEAHVFCNPYLGYKKSTRKSAKTLFIAPESQKIASIEEMLDQTIKHNQEVIFVPLIQSYDFSDSQIVHLFNARSNLVIIDNKLLNYWRQMLKNWSDIFLSVVLLPVIFPILAIIALLIKREEPNGKVFFVQTRMGKNSTAFKCYKFRSMREDADEVFQTYLQEHPEEVENYRKYHKYENDPRITKIGAFLRKTSLDELPQIFNVLRGEMSLIGPRPYMTNERHKIGGKIPLVLAVKPGITGIWQVNGRSEVDFISRVEMDAWYVRNWSLWTDYIILLKTIQVVLMRKGAC